MITTRSTDSTLITRPFGPIDRFFLNPKGMIESELRLAGVVGRVEEWPDRWFRKRYAVTVSGGYRDRDFVLQRIRRMLS